MEWCFEHPTQASVGVCAACARGCCHACAHRARLAKPVCPTCGKLLGPRPVAGWSDVWQRLFSAQSVIMAVTFSVGGLVMSALGSISLGFILLALRLAFLGAMAAYYFNVIQRVGSGVPGMPGPLDMLDNIGTMMLRGFRGIGCLLAAFAPVIIWAFAGHQHGAGVHGSVATIIALLLLGQSYMPAVLLAVTFGNNGWNALWPPAWIRVVHRAPGPYASFVMLWLATVILGGAISAALGSAAGLVPYAGAIVGGAVSMLFWWLQAILVGRFIQQNREAFGWD
jgi:hypothetical protein